MHLKISSAKWRLFGLGLNELIKLSECQKTAPWKVITPAWRKLQWMEPAAVGSRSIIAVRSGTKRKVARVLHEGMYLPGFIKDGTFFASTMEDKMIKCSESFQFLTYQQLDDYMWMDFTVGNEVPLSAFVGGYWRDETPVYIVSAKTGSAWKSGFYSATTGRVYVYVKDSNVQIRQQWALKLLHVK